MTKREREAQPTYSEIVATLCSCFLPDGRTPVLVLLCFSCRCYVMSNTGPPSSFTIQLKHMYGAACPMLIQTRSTYTAIVGRYISSIVLLGPLESRLSLFETDCLTAGLSSPSIPTALSGNNATCVQAVARTLRPSPDLSAPPAALP